MKSLISKFLLILSLLFFFIQPSAYGAGGKLSQVTAALKKNLVVATLSLALVGGMLPLASQAQERQEAQEEVAESPWTIVDETTPQYDYLHNVFNLHAASKTEPETQFLFPVAYLGKSVQGEDIFIAYERPGVYTHAKSLLEETAANVDLSLINYRGEVWENVSITGHVVAKNIHDGFFDLVIFAVAGAELELPSPLQLGVYPHDDGGAMVRVASYQRQHRYANMLEEEIAAGVTSLPLRTRDDCRVVVNPNWKSLGVGLHTCSGFGADADGFAAGALVFYNHRLAAIQNAAVQGVTGNIFGLVRGMSPDVVALTEAMLAGRALPVEARGKLTTMWGALKKE